MGYPRRALALALSLSALIAAGSVASFGVPAPALSLGWYQDACDDGEAQNPGEPGACRYGARESLCADGVDNDSDELSDCLDGDCSAALACDRGGGCVPVPEICGDGIDQDCDGADAACCPWWNPWCDLPIDVCPNLPGAQPNVPDGYALDASGNCSPVSFCDGTKVCDQGCPEYDECACDPSAAGCDDGGGGGDDCLTPCESPSCNGYDLCDCEPDDPSCGDAFEICGNGADDDSDGEADCGDSDCSGNCECQGTCLTNCEDPDACNYGASGGCSYCECDGEDNNEDGQVDEEGESCAAAAGCSDSNAANYDPQAPVGADRDESCDYEMNQTVSVSVGGGVAAGFGASPLAALGNLFAADPGNIQSFTVALRMSLSRTAGGQARFTISGQVAPQTGSGQWPMGFIQATPTLSFTKEGLAPTPPYVSDDVTQAYIHRAIDSGFYGEKAAAMHSILQKTTDVWHYVRGSR